jgi:hypothetical protein
LTGKLVAGTAYNVATDADTGAAEKRVEAIAKWEETLVIISIT